MWLLALSTTLDREELGIYQMLDIGGGSSRQLRDLSPSKISGCAPSSAWPFFLCGLALVYRYEGAVGTSRQVTKGGGGGVAQFHTSNKLQCENQQTMRVSWWGLCVRDAF